MKEPTPTKGVTSRGRQATQLRSRVTTQEDPFDFGFVDRGETDVDQRAQRQDANGEPSPLPPGELPAQDEPQDPERHRHPEATCRSARQPNPTRRLIESAYAVLDETDAVEDYETQVLAEDLVAFVASTSNPDTLHYNKAMNADDSAEFKMAMLEEVNAHTQNDHWEVMES
jgi:hypothetical protein